VSLTRLAPPPGMKPEALQEWGLPSGPKFSAMGFAVGHTLGINEQAGERSRRKGTQLYPYEDNGSG
jgi:hypothetical protein